MRAKATLLLLLLLPGLLTQTLRAEAGDAEIHQHPGFVDFSELGVFDEEDLEFHISVKGPLLALVAASTRDSDPDLSSMLEGLKAIEVLVYGTPAGSREPLRKSIAKAASTLQDLGWATAVTLRTQDAYGYLLLRLQGGRTTGLTAMYVENLGDTFLVNIVGEIEAAQIGRLTRRFNIDLPTDGLFVPPEKDPVEQP